MEIRSKFKYRLPYSSKWKGKKIRKRDTDMSPGKASSRDIPTKDRPVGKTRKSHKMGRTNARN